MLSLEDKPPVVINARFLTQPVTGVQRFAIEISLRLKKLLPGAVFVSPRNIVQKKLAAALEVEKYGSFTSHLWEQVELPLFLRKMGNPLLICLCNTAPLFYKNKAVCIHDLAFLINPEWFSKSFSKLYSLLIPRLAKGARKVITVSEYSKETIESLLHISPANIEVIYNAVSEDVFNTSGNKEQSSFGNYILAVGSLDPRKNLKKLIIAFISCQLPDMKLVIVGSASKIFNDAELQQLVQQNHSVVLTGYLTDEELKKVYQQAKLFVYPSLFEGFGIPPLEAMHCGCATMVSNSSSLPEVCAEASFYVNPESMEEIAQGIKTLLENEDLRSSLIAKGFERSKGFSWKSSSEKLLEVIEALR